MSLGRGARLLGAMLTTLLVASLIHRASADDLVVEATGADLSGRTRRTGLILDYSRDGLRLRTATGREVTIPADRVRELTYHRSAAQEAGDAALMDRRYEEAYGHYRKALSAEIEPRGWVRQEIVAAGIRAARAMGREAAAGDMFMTLISAAPNTAYFDAIPLAWTPSEAAPPAKAQAWLSHVESPAAILLGASHLLATNREAQAIDALSRLATNRDPRIAALARAQLWRTRVAAATAEEIARWADTISAIPDPLRAGPYYILGTTLAQQGKPESAALALMRLPIQYPHEQTLASEALLAAAKCLEKLGDREGEQRLCDELLVHYPKSLAAAEAHERRQERPEREEKPR